ncbi:hypothetical protein PoB_005004500 [Plakobranchus ocellatus]|uniref:Uncharacterized protein n=1 Tax=Plakobranchus ocellatus TaxID=259542 RepID=A0AAV4BW22_9GAST|nr:hypothetical protein PoB_005004500 [Plakobranchus ocellatus]
MKLILGSGVSNCPRWVRTDEAMSLEKPVLSIRSEYTCTGALVAEWITNTPRDLQGLFYRGFASRSGALALRRAYKPEITLLWTSHT